MQTISEALTVAIRHHQSGRLQAAEHAYRQILILRPNHPDALHLLGVIASQVGRHELAIQYIGQAIKLQGNAFVFHNNLGQAYRALRRMPEAIACYRRALELEPGNAEIYGNLGNALQDQGHPDEAIACFRRALELKPDYPEMHNNLGVVLYDEGNLDEAAACYRRALELKPDYPEAHNNLGNTHKDKKRLDEAVACYRRALELKPDYPKAHNNLGNTLKEQEKLDEAVACYRRALEQQPDYAEAHNNLGVTLKEQGHLGAAVACYRRALELKPDCAEIYSNLGNVLNDQWKLDEAVACCRRALELKPDYAEAHLNLGDTLNDQGRLVDAAACYRHVLELKPDCAAAYGSLGGVLEQFGDFQGAEDCFRAALQHAPRFAFAHQKLAELLRGKLPEIDLAAQRQLLEEPRLTDSQRLLLHFGLAQVRDARGEYAKAAEHLERGNSLQLAEWHKRGQAYDPKEHELLVAQMMAACTAEFFAGVRGFGLESEIPVFVTGLPRSGTTLIEQILASHSQVHGGGEIKWVGDIVVRLGRQGTGSNTGLHRLDRATAQSLASEHLEKLRALSPTAIRIVDKMPENYLYLGLLATLFPRAKFIHCRRDLCDVAVSCWMTHFQEIRWANDQQHIAHRFHEYQRMMEHWRKVLPAPLLEVDYEETVANLEGVARRLVDWCGLEWEPECLEFHRRKRAIRTASFLQVRQPFYTTSIGRWKHYEEALASLLTAIPGGK